MQHRMTNTANIFPLPAPVTFANKLVSAKKGKAIPSELNSDLILASIWENSNEGMLLTDETGTILMANPAFCLMVGMKMEELLGHHFTCIYAETEDKEKIAKSYNERFKERKTESENEQRFMLHNGHSIEVEIGESYIETDDGQTFLLTRLRDITSERSNQRALVESESKYRGLFANSLLPMFQSNMEGKLINANRAMLKLLGYNSFYELAELNMASDVCAYPEEFKAITEILNQKGYIVNAEIRLKRKNGRIITVLESARRLTDENGKTIGYEGVMEDITARKVLEKKLQEYVWALEESKNELLELNAQKDKLFSILSHDLRSPFSSILGFCEILLNEDEQLSREDRLQFISYIQEAAQEQLSLVNKLLDWSRLESNRIKIDRSEIDLHDIAQRHTNSMIGLANQKQVTLENHLPKNILVYGDAQLIGQVFSNLISNSLKFTPPNGKISIDLIEERPAQWVIGVKDTGIGIPEDDQNKLFKIEEKYTRKGLRGEKGTGLGLPLVYEIIQRHHGNIELQSKPGYGTTFIITLPKSRPEEGDVILLAGSERESKILYSRYLRNIAPSLNILHATDMSEVIQFAEEFQPKAIILCDEIQNIDEYELMQNLKNNPNIKNIPVIVVTNNNSEINHNILKRCGVAFVLGKPFTDKQLMEALESVKYNPQKAQL